MKVKVIGRNRPFWKGSLLKIGDVIDVTKEEADKSTSWMQPVRGKKPAQLDEGLAINNMEDGG